MKWAERIVVVLLLGVLIAGGTWLYVEVQNDRRELRESVARGDFEIRDEPLPTATEDWRAIYPNTVPILIRDVPVEASVADSLSERIKGLSGTPFIPENVVKLFAFGLAGSHSIWMKDMNYSIDILWLNETGVIVHIETNISPDTFPQSFSSPTPAWFVVETAAGFVSTHNIAIGDQVALPTQ